VPVDTDGDSVADDLSPFQGGASVTVNFTNDVSVKNYSPLYTKASSLSLQYSLASPQDYTFEVFTTNGTLLHTASGQATGGILSRSWNYTDLSGTAVNDRAYVFSLTHSPPSGGGAAAAQKKLFITNFFDQGVTVGKYVVSYGEYANTSLNDGMSAMNAYISTVINGSAYYYEETIGPGRENYNPVYVDFHSDPFKIRRATQTNDLIALTNALKSSLTGSWLFQGHSGMGNIIRGVHPSYLDVDLSAKQMAAFLGNQFGFRQGGTYLASYGKRLFSTMIVGCGAGHPMSDWPVATGTPPGVDQASNGQIKKSAFLGFAMGSFPGTTKWNWVNRIHTEWLDGEEYDTEISTAVFRANVAFPDVTEWLPTLYGFSFLGYNGNESR
jgi:hypothetical protein